jgi:hypothetical protein
MRRCLRARIGLLGATAVLAMGFVFSSPLTAAAIDDQVFTGSGTQAVGPFSMAAGLAVFDWTGTSSSNFIVWLKDSSANDVALIANIIGSGVGPLRARRPAATTCRSIAPGRGA